jgi:hypothetical protein
MKNRSPFIVLGLSTSLFACGEAEKANRHLESMEKTLAIATKQAERMADAIEALQKLGVDTLQIFNSGFKAKPPAPTDDIDDILKMDDEPKKEEKTETQAEQKK